MRAAKLLKLVDLQVDQSQDLLCAILARCNRLTQEILLRGLGVLKTTVKLTGRPDLWENTQETVRQKYTHLTNHGCLKTQTRHKMVVPNYQY